MLLLAEGEPFPLFYDEALLHVSTDEEKGGSRLARIAEEAFRSWPCLCLTRQCWLAEEPETASLLFRYIRKAIDAPVPLKRTLPTLMFSNSRVCGSGWIGNGYACLQFVRFQKAADGTFLLLSSRIEECPSLGNGAFQRPFCRPVLVDLRHQACVWLLLRFEGGAAVVFGEDSREGHLVTGMLDESLMDKDEKAFPASLENLFQGNLHQGTAESPEAQARHACALLEVFDGEADLVFSLLPSSCCAEQFYAGYSAFRLVSVSSECMYVRFCSLVKCRAARDWHLSAGA